MDKVEALRRAPLRFHRIYTAFFLPVGIVGNIILLVQSISLILSDPSLLNIWGVAERVLYLFLSVIAIRGLAWFRRKGLIAVFILQFTSVVLALIMAYMMLFSYNQAAYGYSYMISALFSVLLIIYYMKRWKYFTKEGLSIEEMQAFLRPPQGFYPAFEEQREEEVPEPVQEEEVIGEYDCPRCGRHITDGAVFCPKCGAQTRKVNR